MSHAITSPVPSQGKKRTFSVLERDFAGLAHVVRALNGREERFFVIDEFRPDSDFDGRAFRLTKVAPGREGMWRVLRDGDTGDAAAYDVFLARDGQNHHCDCRGSERWGKCYHRDLILALIDRGDL